MRKLAFALVPLLSMASYFPALAQAPIQGTWQGQYICGGIPYALTLTVSGADQTHIAARATVRPTTGTTGAEFEMTGVVDSNGLFELRPTRQLKRFPGFRPAGYRGQLSSDKRKANASVIFPGCAEFSLQQTVQGAAVTQQAPPRLAASRPPAPAAPPRSELPGPMTVATPRAPVAAAPVASMAPALEGSADVICQAESDNQTLARCLWAIIKANPDPTRQSVVGFGTAQLIGAKIFKDVIQQYSVPCSEMSRDLTTVLDAIKRVTRSTLRYEPKTCGEIAGLFRAISTIDPQWAGCPNTDYSMNQFETCIRTFLDRDVEPALRYMFSQLTDNPDMAVPALKFTLMRTKLDDALKAAAESKAAQRRTIASDAENCRKFNPSASMLLISQSYGVLATGAMDGSSSDRFAALQQRQHQVTCHDIIDLADTLEVADPGTPPAVVAEKKCRREAATIYEPGSKGAGVPWDRIDSGRAIKSCEEAVRYSPDDRVIKLMMARALIVSRRTDEGIKILQDEAALGNPVAMMLMHDLFADGRGQLVDKAVAASWVATAAQTGNAIAQGMLGTLYFTGDGIKKDSQLAAEWLNKAGDSRLPAATTLLGVLYYTGEGVGRDDVRAVKLFDSAQNFDCMAFLYYTRALEEGRGGLSNQGETIYLELKGRYGRVPVNPNCSPEMTEFANRRREEVTLKGGVGPARPGDKDYNPGGGFPACDESDKVKILYCGMAASVRHFAQFQVFSDFLDKSGLISKQQQLSVAKSVEENWDRHQKALERDCQQKGFTGVSPSGLCY
ncbi:MULTISPECIES: tetratricopeptide repeat protein [unclassified Nitrobacter]|uniref:tetratricopeptide repeat protein n=1 Tax=unclassified Nitrobacter TaxID=2620411 RepID=UPI001AD2209F|nr:MULTISPECIES: tetratricopeptide repeat protein [unclassified Nitrobacter]MBN9149337.1 sel1 repeat family protein [Nitrobacter sp.]